MQITVCGVPEVVHYIDQAHGVISIMDPGYTIFAPSVIDCMEATYRHRVLRLEFHDTWPEILERGEDLFSHEMAETVAAFYESFQTQDLEESELLIHCHQGISRSAAIAIALYAIELGDPVLAHKQVLQQRPQAMPNPWVLSVMDEVLGLGQALTQAVFFASDD